MLYEELSKRIEIYDGREDEWKTTVILPSLQENQNPGIAVELFKNCGSPV